METFTVNGIGSVRYVLHEGKRYAVAPMTMITPGVLAGSKGPLLYTPEDVKESTLKWNGVPITVFHPIDPITGQHLSANSPGVNERQTIGEVRKSTFNGKLRAEAWIDVAKAQKVDPDVMNALESGRPIELSTGLYTENEEVGLGSTDARGRPYSAIARQHQPDHLAILPRNERGACSLEDGCGVLINKSVVSNTDQGANVGKLTNNAPPNQPRHSQTGQWLPMNAGTGDGPVHESAKAGSNGTSYVDPDEQDLTPGYSGTTVADLIREPEDRLTADEDPAQAPLDGRKHREIPRSSDRAAESYPALDAMRTGSGTLGKVLITGNAEDDDDDSGEEEEVDNDDVGSSVDTGSTTTEEMGTVPATNATKKQGDETLTADDYAYVPSNKPSTWKLRIDDKAHVAGAIAALHGGGFRGQRVQIPPADLAKVKAKVRARWLKFNPDKTKDDLPDFLKNSNVTNAWTDEAREASIAARQATAKSNKKTEEVPGASAKGVRRSFGERAETYANSAEHAGNSKISGDFHEHAASQHRQAANDLERLAQNSPEKKKPLVLEAINAHREANDAHIKARNIYRAGGTTNSNPEGINQYTKGGSSFVHPDMSNVSKQQDSADKVRADEKSKKANDLSATAKSPGEHEKAAAAHEKAASAHRDAAMSASTKEGSDYHKGKEQEHDAKAEYHNGLVGNSNPEGINQYTKSGGITKSKKADVSSVGADQYRGSAEFGKIGKDSASALRAAKKGDSAKAIELHNKVAAGHDALAERFNNNFDEKSGSVHKQAADAHREASDYHSKLLGSSSTTNSSCSCTNPANCNCKRGKVMNRSDAITYLTANSSVWEGNEETLNKFSNPTLGKLIQQVDNELKLQEVVNTASTGFKDGSGNAYRINPATHKWEQWVANSNPEGINQYTRAGGEAITREANKASNTTKKTSDTSLGGSNPSASFALMQSKGAMLASGAAAKAGMNRQAGLDKYTNHKEAAQQHTQAMESHQEAAAKDRESGNTEGAIAQGKAAYAHKQAADYHAKMSDVKYDRRTGEPLTGNSVTTNDIVSRGSIGSTTLNDAEDGDGEDEEDMATNTEVAPAHVASKEAAAESVKCDGGKCRDHALAALDSSTEDDHDGAMASHTKAAVAHEKAATMARKQGDNEAAGAHDVVAALHRKAASMHAATTNSNPEGINQYTKGGGESLSAKAHQATKDAQEASRKTGIVSPKSGEAASHSANAAEEASYGSGKDTARYHQKAADAHIAAAKDEMDNVAKDNKRDSGSSRISDYIAAATAHGQAAALHKEAADYHKERTDNSATTNSNPEGINQYTKGGGKDISTKAREATEKANSSSGLTATDKRSGSSALASAKIAEGAEDSSKASQYHEYARDNHANLADSLFDRAKSLPPGGQKSNELKTAAENNVEAAKAHKEASEYHSKLTNNSKGANTVFNRQAALKTLGGLSDRRLQSLVANAKKKKDTEEDDEDEDTENCNMNSKSKVNNEKAQGSNADVIGEEGGEITAGGKESEEQYDEDDPTQSGEGGVKIKKTNITGNQWMQQAPPEVKALVNEALQNRRRGHTLLANKLTNHIPDENLKKRLFNKYMRMDVNDLRDMIAGLPLTVHNTQREPDPFVMPNYYGANSPTDNYLAQDSKDKEDILPIATLNFAEVSEEHAASGRGRKVGG